MSLIFPWPLLKNKAQKKNFCSCGGDLSTKRGKLASESYLGILYWRLSLKPLNHRSPWAVEAHTEVESKEKHGVWDHMPELTVASPYVASNTFTMGNPLAESTLTLSQSRLYPPVRDLGFGLWTLVSARVSFETSFDSKQPKLEPKTSFGTNRNKPFVSVVSLLYRNREFRCFDWAETNRRPTETVW
jgi:hypothetical protein